MAIFSLTYGLWHMKRHIDSIYRFVIILYRAAITSAKKFATGEHAATVPLRNLGSARVAKRCTNYCVRKKRLRVGTLVKKCWNVVRIVATIDAIRINAVQ